jgi:hypothetical protein
MILEKAVPPKLANETRRIALVVDAEWLKRIAIWRRQQPDPLPTMSDAIRRLVSDQLDALSKASDKPKPKKPKS